MLASEARKMLTTVGKGRPSLISPVPPLYCRPLALRHLHQCGHVCLPRFTQVIPVPVTLPTSPELYSSSPGPIVDRIPDSSLRHLALLSLPVPQSGSLMTSFGQNLRLSCSRSPAQDSFELRMTPWPSKFTKCPQLASETLLMQ